MKKSSVIRLSLLVMLSSSAYLYCSTVWIFDEKTIIGHVNDEIDKRIKPGYQQEETKAKLQKFKKKRLESLTSAVEREHFKRPFRTQQEAKAFASSLAKVTSDEFLNKIVRKRIAQRISNLPKKALAFKDQFCTVAKTHIETKAREENIKKGCIAETVKNVDNLINEALRMHFDWTCDVCNWLKN